MSTDAPDEPDDVPRNKKIKALIDVARFNPKFTFLIIGFGLGAAVFEGVGLGFIIPIVELVQAKDPAAQAEGIMGALVRIYRVFGVPLTLGYAIAGISLILIIRYTLSFTVGWFRQALRAYYIRDLQIRAFENALNASVRYYDQEGSDHILNAIITQTYYAGRVILRVVKFIEQGMLSAAYLFVALVIAPTLTVISIVVFGGITVFVRYIIKPGYELGDEVAKANERRQEAAQAGTQGIRDIRIFGLADELLDYFVNAVDRYTSTQVSLRRNEVAIQQFYDLMVAISVFVLIYTAITFADLSFGGLAVFLFAMFRLGPRLSNLNQTFYRIENDLPHLVRTIEFVENLEQHEEPDEGSRRVPDEIKHIEFDNVWFSYDGEEDILRGVDFEVQKGEFVAFVGKSGAGKSTIVSLLTRMYELDQGEIRANKIPIDELDIDEWRDQITIVRQNPYIFDETLEYNLTIGNREASQDKIRQACEIARVDEFIDDLPNGYNSELGDDGVRLSGGQKQRVALARALLEDAELLILDEATSDLDSSLEREIQNQIENLETDYAIITIAHRLSTVKNADRIYTADDGEITETGTHSSLLSNNGTYAELYEVQTRN